MDRGRGRGAQRGANNHQGNQVLVPNDRPVRCSHLTATGAYCRTENFPEAVQCRGCNGRLQGQPLAPPQRVGGRGGQGGDGKATGQGGAMGAVTITYGKRQIC